MERCFVLGDWGLCLENLVNQLSEAHGGMPVVLILTPLPQDPRIYLDVHHRGTLESRWPFPLCIIRAVSKGKTTDSSSDPTLPSMGRQPPTHFL